MMTIAEQVAVAAKVARKPLKFYIDRVIRYAGLTFVGLVLFTPFILAFLGSFKTNAEIIAWPPTFLPSEWHFENWAKLFSTDFGRGATFLRWLFNTAFLSIATALLQLLFCSMAAYAFARLRFRGRGAIFNFLLASMMIPGAVTLVPKYVLLAKLHLVNTYWALLLPGAVGTFGIFLLTQFFKSIPRELEEAALVDGASHFQIYSRIILPLARPALLTLFILQFQGMWNNFLDPLLYLQTPDMWTLNIALMSFQQQYRENWNITLVGAMVNAAPILLLFLFFSKYYIEGISYTGLKG